MILRTRQTRRAVSNRNTSQNATHVKDNQVQPTVRRQVTSLGTNQVAIGRSPPSLLFRRHNRFTRLLRIHQFTGSHHDRLPIRAIRHDTRLHLIHSFSGRHNQTGSFFLRRFITVSRRASIDLRRLQLHLVTLLHTTHRVFSNQVHRRFFRTFTVTTRHTNVRRNLHQLLDGRHNSLLSRHTRLQQAGASRRPQVNARLPTTLRRQNNRIAHGNFYTYLRHLQRRSRQISTQRLNRRQGQLHANNNRITRHTATLRQANRASHLGHQVLSRHFTSPTTRSRIRRTNQRLNFFHDSGSHINSPFNNNRITTINLRRRQTANNGYQDNITTNNKRHRQRITYTGRNCQTRTSTMLARIQT